MVQIPDPPDLIALPSRIGTMSRYRFVAPRGVAERADRVVDDVHWYRRNSPSPAFHADSPAIALVVIRAAAAGAAGAFALRGNVDDEQSTSCRTPSAPERAVTAEDLLARSCTGPEHLDLTAASTVTSHSRRLVSISRACRSTRLTSFVVSESIAFCGAAASCRVGAESLLVSVLERYRLVASRERRSRP